ncbi:MAG: hypothetical protein L3K15_00965 [Thermoplasmata archaeon]|nr:hypothetical protein [Thermoplasmata archaeon]
MAAVLVLLPQAKTIARRARGASSRRGSNATSARSADGLVATTTAHVATASIDLRDSRPTGRAR